LAQTRPNAAAFRWLPLSALLCAAWAGSVQSQGISPLGASGGLVIPKAMPLPEGTIEASVSNQPEPGLQNAQRQRSIVLGFGVLDGVEVSGRFAEYAIRRGGFLEGGISDLSLNAKLSWAWGDGPAALRLGAGVLDFGGQATNFRTGYLVGSQALGPWDLTLGAGKSDGALRVPGQKRALDGVFGGLSLELTSPSSRLGRLEVAAEHDSRQAILGAKWASPRTDWLGQGRLTAALHRSLAAGATHPAATVVTLGVSLPLAESERQAETLEAPTPAATRRSPEAAWNAPTAQLARLKDQLVAQGLEAVRTGRLKDGSWVVAFQNRRFTRNEADALGLVAGLAADAAGPDVKGLILVAYRQGLPTWTLKTDPGVWRQFLQTGLPGLARGATRVERGTSLSDSEVDWVSDAATGTSRAQMMLTPELAYTMGTEVGMADYSLAARTTATVPLWKGGQLLVAHQQLLSTSRNAQPGAIFSTMRQTEGLYTVAVHQTFWLGQRAVAGLAVGTFEHRASGAEGEAVVFFEGRDDVLRLRGRAVKKVVDLPRYADLAGQASYRWWANPSLAVEVGSQRYTDGSGGAMVNFSRWWGDVGAHLTFRQGGWRKYAGVEFSFPLTPRSVRAVGPVVVQGTPSWRRGLRSMVDNPANYVEPRAVRDLQVTWDLETHVLNAGRGGQEYLLAQLPRMREAYFLYAPTNTGASSGK
jgi:Exopolysaccharide biosynthesis protein YbjH